jgi:hypothetical protein
MIPIINSKFKAHLIILEMRAGACGIEIREIETFIEPLCKLAPLLLATDVIHRENNINTKIP